MCYAEMTSGGNAPATLEDWYPLRGTQKIYNPLIVFNNCIKCEDMFPLKYKLAGSSLVQVFCAF